MLVFYEQGVSVRGVFSHEIPYLYTKFSAVSRGCIVGLLRTFTSK